MHYTKLRIENDMNRPLNSGRIAVQSEGNIAYYRNMYIKLLPGDPLYTPTYAEFNARNTIRRPTGRKVLILKNGVLAIQESSVDVAGKTAAEVFDIGGRLLPAIPEITH